MNSNGHANVNNVNSDGNISGNTVDNVGSGVRFIFQMLTSMMVKIYNKKLWWNFGILRIINCLWNKRYSMDKFLKTAE